MAGRSTSLGIATFTGVRVVGRPTYIPAYIKADGSKVGQKCEITVVKNDHRGHDRDGNPGRKDSFRLVAWNKLADSCAKSLAPGKAIDVVCEPQSYKGDVYVNKQPVTDNAGNRLQTTKTSFTILRLAYGEDSKKTINEEIARGDRPQDWDKEGTPGYQTWRNILQERQQTQFDPSRKYFGWAEVRVPAGVQLDFTAMQPKAAPQQHQQAAGYNTQAVGDAGGFGGGQGRMTGAVDQAYRMSQNGGGAGGFGGGANTGYTVANGNGNGGGTGGFGGI